MEMPKEAQQMLSQFCKYAENFPTNRKEKISLFFHTLDSTMNNSAGQRINCAPD